MSNKNFIEHGKGNQTKGGIGFCSLLAIVFIVLKLIGVIEWSWWIVLLPLYVPAIVALLIFALFMVLVLIKVKIDKSKESE